MNAFSIIHNVSIGRVSRVLRKLESEIDRRAGENRVRSVDELGSLMQLALERRVTSPLGRVAQLPEELLEVFKSANNRACTSRQPDHLLTTQPPSKTLAISLIYLNERPLHHSCTISINRSLKLCEIGFLYDVSPM